MYLIAPQANPDYAVTAASNTNQSDNNITLSTINERPSQQFRVTHVGDGFYTLQSEDSYKYLSVESGGNTPETKVIQENNTGLAMQKWFITYNENGSYSLSSLYNGLTFDITGGVIDSGTNIQVWEENNGEPQQFIFKK